MPSLITHYLCGEKSLNITGSKPVRDIINKYRQVFNLGTQGPDIFFFYGILPLPGSKEVNEVAEMLHHENVGSYFHGALDYVLSKADSMKELLTSYLLGFACHYALDLSTHPYIIYKSGFLRKGEPKSHKFSFYHHKFEKAVDILMLERERGIKPSETMVHRFIKIQNNEAEPIGEMYEKLIHDVYGIDISKDKVTRSIAYMPLIYSFSRDKHGLKSRLLSNPAKHFDWARLAVSYVYPESIPKEMDYLNLKHSTWFLPWDKSIAHSDSFVELFDKAALESKELFNAIYSCVYGSMPIEKAAERIGSRSFSTGEDCTANLEFKYYDCIFE